MHLRPATLLTAILAGLILLAPVTANAATTPTPSPTATTGTPGTPEQNPIVDGQNITVTLKDLKGGKGEAEPVPGVTLTVFKDSKTGEEIGTQVTDQAGRVSIAIPATGSMSWCSMKTLSPKG